MGNAPRRPELHGWGVHSQSAPPKVERACLQLFTTIFPATSTLGLSKINLRIQGRPRVTSYRCFCHIVNLHASVPVDCTCFPFQRLGLSIRHAGEPRSKVLTKHCFCMPFVNCVFFVNWI